MRLAQILQFDQRRAIGRRCAVQTGSGCVILQLSRTFTPRCDLSATPIAARDDDQFPGRGRDPG
jgi:hypothetical protein